jgi:hypothetical protein
MLSQMGHNQYSFICLYTARGLSPTLIAPSYRIMKINQAK